MNYSKETGYGIPHPIHTIVHAETIINESIPSIPLEDIGVDSDLIAVLQESGLHTVGDLASRNDDELYNLESPIDREDFVHMQRCLGRVGLSIEEKDTFHFGQQENVVLS